jgi:hypothetical protein
MPYSIALLVEIGFVDHLYKEIYRTKKELNEKMGKIFDVSDRRIRGNINILNPGSKDDRAQYTSHTYIATIKKELENQ